MIMTLKFVAGQDFEFSVHQQNGHIRYN